MKSVSHLLLGMLLLTASTATPTYLSEVLNTVRNTASPYTVLTHSLYSKTTRLLNTIANPDLPIMKQDVQNLVRKRLTSVLLNPEVGEAIVATMAAGFKSGLTGMMLALVPYAYQDEVPFEEMLQNLSTEASMGFVTGAVAGLGSHLLEKGQLKENTYTSAAIEGFSNMALIPTGATTLLSSLSDGAKSLIVDAVNTVLSDTIEEAGGITGLLQKNIQSEEILSSDKTKALTKPLESSALLTEKQEALAKQTANLMNLHWSRLFSYIKEPLHAMAVGAITGYCLDGVLGINFAEQLGPEYYMILGALQALVSYARLENYNISIAGNLLSSLGFSGLMLRLMDQGSFETRQKALATITYGALVPISAAAATDLISLLGGWQGAFKKVAKELGITPERIELLSMENLKTLAHKAVYV